MAQRTTFYCIDAHTCGSQFTGRVEAETRVGDFPAIITSIEGWARVYGHNVITVDPDDDPFWKGSTVT